MKQISRLIVVALGVAALLTLGCGGSSGGGSAKACETGDECESGLCEDGKCTPVPTQTNCDPACNADQQCVDGKCIDNTLPPTGCDPPCSGTETCIDGQCLDNTPPPTGCDPPCASDEECVDNQCLKDIQPPLGCTPPCSAGQECVNGQCVGDTPPPSGSTCGEGIQCANACSQGDEACIANCFSQLSPEENAKLEALIGCVQSTCGQQPAEGCVQQALGAGGACATQAQACLGSTGPGPGPAGIGSCGAALQCAQACSDRRRAQSMNFLVSAYDVVKLTDFGSSTTRQLVSADTSDRRLDKNADRRRRQPRHFFARHL